MKKQEELVSAEVAEKEWRDFLDENDANHILPDEDLKNSQIKEDRDEYHQRKDQLNRIIKGIQKGNIIIDDGVISQILKFPITNADGTTVIVDKLVFNKRWTAKDRENIMQNVNTKNPGAMLAVNRCFCALITGIEELKLKRLDSQDLKITDVLVDVFFM